MFCCSSTLLYVCVCTSTVLLFCIFTILLCSYQYISDKPVLKSVIGWFGVAVVAAVVTVKQVANNSSELFSNCRLTHFSGTPSSFFLTASRKSAVFATALSTIMPFPQCALALRCSCAGRQTAVLVYKQALSYFPILGHSCSIQHSAGCHVRAGNAGFIKRGREDRGGSPALRDDDKSRVWCFTGL